MALRTPNRFRGPDRIDSESYRILTECRGGFPRGAWVGFGRPGAPEAHPLCVREPAAA